MRNPGLDDEAQLIAGKRGPTRLGFPLLLKFYTRWGRFPRGRGELPDEAVSFVTRQVGVEPGELGFYEWSGSTIAYHRAQIRSHLGFRDNAVAESFNSTLEFELLTGARFATRAQARTAVAGFLDEYNHDRRHSTAGRLPPAVYEARVRTEHAA